MRTFAESGRRINLMSMGHPKHGKSSLMGALIYAIDTATRPEASADWSSLFAAWNREQWWQQDMAFAFILDRTKQERLATPDHQRSGQSITRSYHDVPIEDVSYTVVDSPGHLDLFRVFLISFSQADIGVLVVAADAIRDAWRTYDDLQQKGTKDWRQAGGAWVHATLASLFGLSDIITVISKMDSVGYSRADFEQAKEESLAVLASIPGLGSIGRTVIPVAVLPADLESRNVDRPAPAVMPWYDGPCLREALANVAPPDRPTSSQFCLQIGEVRQLLKTTMIVGEIVSGSVSVRDSIAITSPELRRSLTARVRRIFSAGDPAFLGLGKTTQLDSAGSGRIVALDCGLAREMQKIISSGAIVTASETSVFDTKHLTGQVFIIRSVSPIRVGITQLDLQVGTYRGACRITEVHSVHQSVHTDTVRTDIVQSGDLITATFELDEPVAIPRNDADPRFRRIVLLQHGFLVGGGTLLMGQTAGPL